LALFHFDPRARLRLQALRKVSGDVTGYIREADKWTKSSLKGVGF
jgi:hypothetical protein